MFVISVCLPSDALSQHLTSLGVSLTLDIGYLLTAALLTLDIGYLLLAAHHSRAVQLPHNPSVSLKSV